MSLLALGKDETVQMSVYDEEERRSKKEESQAFVVRRRLSEFCDGCQAFPTG